MLVILIFLYQGFVPLPFDFPYKIYRPSPCGFPLHGGLRSYSFSYRFEIAKLSISADMTKFLPSAFTILIKKGAGVQWIMNDE